MGDIGKVIDGLNIPKQLLDKGEKAFKAVLGPSVKELAETLGDSFRLRRFKNQVKILQKAEKFLSKKGLTAKKLDLKVLVPLLHNISLEENSNLQDGWARLISNLVTIDSNDVIKKRAVEALSNLTNSDITVLDFIFRYSIANNHQIENYLKNVKEEEKISDLYKYIERYFFSVWILNHDFNAQLPKSIFELHNLIDIGLLEYKKDLKFDIRSTSYHGGKDTPLTKENFERYVKLESNENKQVRLTRFGFEFITLCREGDIKDLIA